ncbi:MAG: hypothetical protein HZA48_12750 [Planctomycetes bacterium]|nr:hypothetical protein [Planctomycetota bacterium]
MNSNIKCKINNLKYGLLIFSAAMISCATQPAALKDFDSLMSSAVERTADEKFSEASVLYHQALQIDPNSARARTGLAMSYCLLKQWDFALNEAETVLGMYPSDSGALFIKASSLLAKNKYAESAEIFGILAGSGVSMFSNRDRDVFTLAFLRALQYYESALHLNEGYELADIAAKAFPEIAIFHSYLAFFAHELGNDELAEREYDSALGLNPYNTNAVIKARAFFMEKREFQKALDAWLKIAPRVMILDEKSSFAPRYEELINLIIICEADKNNAALLQNLALVCKKTGWLKEAVGICDYVCSMQADGQAEFAENLRVVTIQHLGFLERLKKETCRIYDDYYFNGKETGIYEFLSLVKAIDPAISELKEGVAAVMSNTPYVGEINSFNNAESPLCAYFMEYGEFVSITSYLGLLDVSVMPVLFWENSDRKILNKTHRVDYLAGDYNIIDTMSEYVAGYPQIAGFTFLTSSGFYVNAETLRPSAKSMKYLKELLGRNVPEEVRNAADEDAVVEPFYSEYAARALALKAFEDAGIDADNSDLWNIVFMLNVEAVKRHELGHIHDTKFFTPFSENLMNNLLLGIEQMFSPAQIRSRFESAAETTGILYMKPAHWMLYENILRLRPVKHDLIQKIYATWGGEEPENSVYYKIAVSILEGMAMEICRNPQKYPEIDCKRNISQQLHKLTEEQVRAIAVRLLPEYIVK